MGATAACPTSPSTFAATTPPNRSTTSTGWWTLHDLYFGSTPEELLALDDSFADELRPLLARAGYDSGDGSRDLDDWIGEENFEERWHDGKVDPVVLEQLGRAGGPL